MKHTEPLTRRHIALWMTATFVLLTAFTAYTARFLYPGVFYPASGIGKLMLISAGTGFVLGPVLVTFLWVPGKKGLWLDMTVMALLQILLWSACGWVLYTQRPVWLVFAQDRFVVLREDEIKVEDLPQGITTPRPGHPTLVIATQPEDPVFRQLIMFEAAGGGPDIERYAQLWRLPSAGDLAGIGETQARNKAYYGEELPIAGELLLIGTRQDLLVQWDKGLQRIVHWRAEPLPAHD